LIIIAGSLSTVKQSIDGCILLRIDKGQCYLDKTYKMGIHSSLSTQTVGAMRALKIGIK